MRETIGKIFIGIIFGFVIAAITIVAIGADGKATKLETEEIAGEITEAVVVTPEPVTSLAVLEPEPVEQEEVTEEISEVEFIPLDIPLDADIQEYLKAKCEDANIDLAFVLALIDTESLFNADAHSNTNDYGLFQINKCNHKSLSLATGATDFLNPYQNIDAGIYMLTDLFGRYGEAEAVLMAYHFGEGGAKKLWKQGKYSSKYSTTILEKQLTYQNMIEEAWL